MRRRDHARDTIATSAREVSTDAENVNRVLMRDPGAFHSWRFVAFETGRRGALVHVCACVLCGAEQRSNRPTRPGPCVHRQQVIEWVTAPADTAWWALLTKRAAAIAHERAAVAAAGIRDERAPELLTMDQARALFAPRGRRAR